MQRKCAYEKCGKLFTPRTHNQRYDDPECCRRATNSRIMEDYYAKKERRKGTVRLCAAAGCKTVLSRYNDDKICGACASSQATQARDDLLRMLSVAR